MTQYYKPKRKTGREYVDKTKDFVGYAMFILSNMPASWEQFLTIPAADIAERIEDSVIYANRIYIPDDTRRTIIALEERDKVLFKVLRYFDVFDAKFEHITDKIDLMTSEKTRLEKLLLRVIKEAEKQGKTECRISIDKRPDDICFTTSYGKEIHKLKFSIRQMNHLLKLEDEAVNAVRSRLTQDTNKKKELRREITE